MKTKIKTPKRVFVTGASGMLGTALHKIFTDSGIKVVSTDLSPLDPWTKKLDIRNHRIVSRMIKEAKPDYVLNLAALTDLEYCEAHQQEAYDTNAKGAINIAKVCSKLGIPMVHISTVGVFDGTKKGAHTEDDIPNPINVYGKSKYESEKQIPEILTKHFIFRAGWMMGSYERDKKFVRKVLSLVNNGHNVIYGLTDKYGCPTYVNDFAKGILHVITNSTEYGLYNMVSSGNCSRYDVAKKIVEVLRLDHIDVVPVTGAFFKKEFSTPRPENEVMENKKLVERKLNIMRHWEACIADYLKHYYDTDYKEVRRRDVYEVHRPKKSVAKEPLVSVVTTAYKNEPFNKKYFDSINKQTYKSIEVIFVDNMSPDDTVAGARKMLKDGKVVASKINTGCAAGNNMGVVEASGKYVFLMGPDAWADKNCVARLVEEAEKNDNYIYAPMQMTYDGKEFISCGIAADVFGYPARTYTLDGRIQTRRAFYADGSGVFITKKNYLKVGMMDSSSFLFAEDVELSWKAHMMGLDVVPVKSAVIYHWSGGSVGIGGYPKGGKYETKYHRRFLAERNIIRNIIKNYSWWNVLWVLPYYIMINFAEMLALAATGQADAVYPTYINAYIWNIQNFKSTMVKRKLIQNSRKVSDFHVLKKMYFIPHKFFALLELGVPRVTK